MEEILIHFCVPQDCYLLLFKSTHSLFGKDVLTASACHKLNVFEPSVILIVSTAGPPNAKSKMYSVIEENTLGSKIVTVPRQYWSETAGLDYIQSLVFKEDVEAIKVAIGGNYYATCCFSAVGNAHSLPVLEV